MADQEVVVITESERHGMFCFIVVWMIVGNIISGIIQMVVLPQSSENGCIREDIALGLGISTFLFVLAAPFLAALISKTKDNNFLSAGGCCCTVGFILLIICCIYGTQAAFVCNQSAFCSHVNSISEINQAINKWKSDHKDVDELECDEQMQLFSKSAGNYNINKEELTPTDKLPGIMIMLPIMVLTGLIITILFGLVCAKVCK